MRAISIATARIALAVGGCSSPPSRDFQSEFKSWQAAGIDDYDLTLDVEDPAGGPRSPSIFELVDLCARCSTASPHL